MMSLSPLDIVRENLDNATLRCECNRADKVVDSNIIAQGEHLSAREKVVSEGLQNMLRILDHNNELASIDWYGHRIRYVDDAMTLLAVCN